MDWNLHQIIVMQERKKIGSRLCTRIQLPNIPKEYENIIPQDSSVGKVPKHWRKPLQTIRDIEKLSCTLRHMDWNNVDNKDKYWMRHSNK